MTATGEDEATEDVEMQVAQGAEATEVPGEVTTGITEIATVTATGIATAVSSELGTGAVPAKETATAETIVETATVMTVTAEMIGTAATTAVMTAEMSAEASRAATRASLFSGGLRLLPAGLAAPERGGKTTGQASAVVSAWTPCFTKLRHWKQLHRFAPRNSNTQCILTLYPLQFAQVCTDRSPSVGAGEGRNIGHERAGLGRGREGP